MDKCKLTDFHDLSQKKTIKYLKKKHLTQKKFNNVFINRNCNFCLKLDMFIYFAYTDFVPRIYDNQAFRVYLPPFVK